MDQQVARTRRVPMGRQFLGQRRDKHALDIRVVPATSATPSAPAKALQGPTEPSLECRSALASARCA